MNYALVAERSGSGKKYDSSAERSSVVAKIIERCCKRGLRENSALKTEEYSKLYTVRNNYLSQVDIGYIVCILSSALQAEHHLIFCRFGRLGIYTLASHTIRVNPALL